MKNKNIYMTIFALVIILVGIFFVAQLFSLEITSKAIYGTDRMPPTVEITSPQESYTTLDSFINVEGTVSDNFRVKEIRIKINDGNWEKISNPGRFWSISLRNLEKGENIIYVQAIDTSENASPVSSVRVVYV